VFHYSIYGLILVSDTELPELRQLQSPAPDQEIMVSVCFRAPSYPTTACDSDNAEWLLTSNLPSGQHGALCGRINGGYLLRFPGLTDFIISRDGRDLRCTYFVPGTPLDTLRHLLLDRVLPLVLNLLGANVLHATAVLTPAGVCAFIGPAGAGKSTLAAFLSTAGYQPFCDDCMVVRLNGDVYATPGYPGVRLWDDSLYALGHELTGDSREPRYWKHRVVPGEHLDCARPRRLSAIYRVRRPAAGEPPLSVTRIEQLSGREGLMELVSSSYVLDIRDGETLSRHFRFVERLTGSVRLARVHIPNDFSLLPATRDAILSDLGEK
jgi:hypothetical protein